MGVTQQVMSLQNLDKEIRYPTSSKLRHVSRRLFAREQLLGSVRGSLQKIIRF